MKIDLPFPPWELAPNNRTDRRSLTKLRKSFREECAWRAKISNNKEKILQLSENGSIPIVLLFYPPNGNRRDIDNCITAMKYGLDGVAKVWGIDDSIFRPITADIIAPDKTNPRCELYIDNIDIVLKMYGKGQKNVKKAPQEKK